MRSHQRSDCLRWLLSDQRAPIATPATGRTGPRIVSRHSPKTNGAVPFSLDFIISCVAQMSCTRLAYQKATHCLSPQLLLYTILFQHTPHLYFTLYYLPITFSCTRYYTTTTTYTFTHLRCHNVGVLPFALRQPLGLGLSRSLSSSLPQPRYTASTSVYHRSDNRTGCFAILNPNPRAYVDRVWAECETISQLHKNGVHTFIFCSFGGTSPRIMGLFCRVYFVK
jgi:hypothetical protein